MEGEKQHNPQPAQKQKEEGALDQDQDSSSWSLASLEQLKSLNLRDLQQHEEGPQPQQKQKELIQVKFPQKPTYLPNAPLHQVGRVAFIVGELLIIESQGGAFVVDLDNWLCDQQRNLIGFVMDVFGKIERPFYALRPEVVNDIASFAGKGIYYIEGTSKILRDQDIKSMKSKSALEAQQDQEDDSDEEKLRVQRDFSEERHDRKRSPPRRVNKFRDHERMDREEGSRERTRDLMRNNNRQASRGRNEQNQRYLSNMYSMHYNTMMRLYNGEYDPYNPPPMQNPYANHPQPHHTHPMMPHPNIAQFGSPNFQNQFYGQVFPNNQGVPPPGFGQHPPAQGQQQFNNNGGNSANNGGNSANNGGSNPNVNPFGGRQ